MRPSSGEERPDELLARLGAELARTVPPALESWVLMRGGQVTSAWWEVTGGSTGSAGLDLLDEQLVAAARRAAEDAATALVDLAVADVEAQNVTPLQIVRSAMAGPTHLLQQAGVPAVVRDRFVEERFPDDLYGLHPPSLAAMSEDLGPLGLAWGAAKAAAHRARRTAEPGA